MRRFPVFFSRCTARYDATIERGGANPVVTLDQNATVESATIGDTLRLSNGKTLTVQNLLTINATGTVDGSGTVAGDVQNNGGLGPGISPGQITIDGDYTQDSAATLFIEVEGLTAGTEYYQVIVTGDASLDGTLDVTLDDVGFDLLFGMQFDILDIGGAANGSFLGLGEGALVLTDSDTGIGLFISYLGGTGNDVVLNAIPEPTTLMMLLALATLGLRRRR